MALGLVDSVMFDAFRVSMLQLCFERSNRSTGPGVNVFEPSDTTASGTVEADV